jgi:hypothetical protein
MIIELVPPDFAAVVAALDPKGWVNLRPKVDPDDDPGVPSNALLGMFGARGPAVPLCTWHPGDRLAGVEHGTGPKVARRIELPVGWRVVQDHPRRGLVVAVPAQVEAEDVLAWLVATGDALCQVPYSGTWLADVRP